MNNDEKDFAKDMIIVISFFVFSFVTLYAFGFGRIDNTKIKKQVVEPPKEMSVYDRIHNNDKKESPIISLTIKDNHGTININNGVINK